MKKSRPNTNDFGLKPATSLAFNNPVRQLADGATDDVENRALAQTGRIRNKLIKQEEI